MNEPSIGSLFSGYGGLDRAVQQVLGGRLAWYSEIDPAASKVLAHHNPGVPNLGDITTIDWASVLPVDILAGGWPCQDISNAGRQASKEHAVDSGDTSQMPCAYYDPGSSCWRTFQQSLLEDLTESSATLPRSGSMRSGVVYERPTWGPPTGASGSSVSPPLLPTPDTGVSPNGHGRRGGKPGNGRQSGASLDAVAQCLLPTPQARDGGSRGASHPDRRKELNPKRAGQLDEVAVHLLPTPTARDGKGPNQRGDSTCLHGALLPTGDPTGPPSDDGSPSWVDLLQTPLFPGDEATES